MLPSNPKVIVIGTGYVGLPAALMWAKSGLSVVGVDINENIVRAINEKTLLLRESELQALLHHPEVAKNLVASTVPSEGDVFVIAVPTPVHPVKKVADLSYVREAIKSLAPFLRRGNLVIVESTIPPLTTRELVKPYIEELTALSAPGDIFLAHCPERILPGDIFKEIVWNDRLIGGISPESSNYAEHLYRFFVRGNLFKTGDVVAELSKLMENTYRDVNIALANEFAQICENLQVDPGEVIEYANKHPRVNILSPGIGVGGHCIPVDPWFLKEVSPYNSRLIAVARAVNDERPSIVASKIRMAVSDIKSPRILAIGATYKKNCEDIRESPAIEVVKLLQRDGYDVEHIDAFVPELQYDSIVERASGKDLIAVLVNHTNVCEELEAMKLQIELIMNHPRIIYFDR